MAQEGPGSALPGREQRPVAEVARVVALRWGDLHHSHQTANQEFPEYTLQQDLGWTGLAMLKSQVHCRTQSLDKVNYLRNKS